MVWEHVVAQSLRRPNATALSSVIKTWTYGEMVSDAEHIAATLRSIGFRRGDRLAMYLNNCPEVILTWLACARIGVVPSVINFLFKGKEFAWVLNYLAPRLVIVDKEHLDMTGTDLSMIDFNPACYMVDAESADDVHSWSEFLAGEGDIGPYPTGDDIVEFTFTSGTTSNPKGAVFTNQAHVEALQAWNKHFSVNEDDVVFAVTPLFHSSGLRYSALSALFAGGRIHLGDGFHPTTYWEDICRVGATLTIAVETMLLILKKMDVSPHERKHRLRCVQGAGDPKLLKRVEKRFGFRQIQSYGMTELGVVCSVSTETTLEELHRLREYRAEGIYVGKAMEGCTIKFVNDQGEELEEGEIGEIWIRAPWQMKAYLNAPEATEEVLSGGWLHKRG